MPARHRRSCSLAAATLLVASTGCGSDPTSPADVAQTLTESLQTRSVSFHYTPGDSVNSDWQQRFHDWATALLRVQVPGRIQYFKYTGRSQMQALTGRATNGWADVPNNAVHSIWQADGHEALHVYTALVGRPSDFFNEGIAVALNYEPGTASPAPQWNGMHVHAHVAMLRRTQRYLPLSSIVTTSNFRDYDDWRTYGEAGSFVFWLVQRYGMEPTLQFFRAGDRDHSRERVEANLRSAYGLSLAEAEQLWLGVVDGWD